MRRRGRVCRNLCLRSKHGDSCERESRGGQPHPSPCPGYGKPSREWYIGSEVFALAEADPGKEDQLRKFTSYYLPTALKLLHTYAQLDGQGVDGENITKTKQSIERSLDLLVTAFENQLDKLFQSDALDVSADIAALEGMLNLDGLSGANDFTPQ